MERNRMKIKYFLSGRELFFPAICFSSPFFCFSSQKTQLVRKYLFKRNKTVTCESSIGKLEMEGKRERKSCFILVAVRHLNIVQQPEVYFLSPHVFLISKSYEYANLYLLSQHSVASLFFPALVCYQISLQHIILSFFFSVRYQI